MKEKASEIINIKELDLELIAPSTSKMFEKDHGGSKIIVIGKPGCFIKGTQILMFNGKSKSIENIKIGDVIMGDDSTPRIVQELCHNFDHIYKIKPYNTKSYSVNQYHKLVLKNDKDELKIISVKKFIDLPQKEREKWFLFKNAVNFSNPKMKLPIKPYIFGIKNHTHIPTIYKNNSYENRLKLLAGILDRHGKYYGSYFKVKNVSVRMKKDILFLAGSLGLRINKHKIEGNLEIIPCLNHKIQPQKQSNLQFKFTIKYCGWGEYFGFTLDGNHLFLLKSFDVVRNTGKTYLIKSLLYKKSHIIPVGLIISGTEDSNQSFSEIFPSSFIYNSYSKEHIEEFIKRQKIAKQHIKNPWSLLLLDDCTDDPKIFNTPLQQGLFKRGRHWKFLYIVSLQYAMDIKPVIRTNVDGIFILRESILINRKKIWENYASIIPDFELFCLLMDKITDDHTALFIFNAAHTNEWKDCVFWYKANSTPANWKFGCNELWAYHNKRYNKEYQESYDI